MALEKLEQNITRLEEDTRLLHACQEQVSDEVNHEVEDALAAADRFINGEQATIISEIDHYFMHSSRSEEAGHFDADEEFGDGKLVLEDESQAQVALSKIRSACEVILLAAQDRITRELAQRFDQLEYTLTRSLHDAMRPIETRIKGELSHAGFRARISLPAFQASTLNFNTRQLFADAIAAEDRPAGQSRVSGVRDSMTRWLNNPGWGWNDFVITRTRYVIDIASLHQNLVNHVAHFCAQIRKALAAQVDISVTAGMATFFAEFSHSLSGLQESLRDSLAIRQQNESTTTALRQHLRQCITTANWIHEDARLLRDDIQTLFAADQP